MKGLASRPKNTMTTRELAEVLGVGVRTVQRTAKRILDPVKVRSQVINGGLSKVFTEEQATAIKLEIQRHHNLRSRQIDSVSTKTEENLIVRQAVEILRRNIREVEERAAMVGLVYLNQEAGHGD